MSHPTLAGTYLTAAATLIELVAEVPAGQWDEPALGSWTVRTLVGHAGRSLSTVADYGSQPAGPITVPDAPAYYAYAATVLSSGDTGVDDRATQAGLALGTEPVATLRSELARAEPVARRPADSPIATFAGVMPLGEYLRTRILELVVHGLDLSAATGIPAAFDDESVRATLSLAADIAIDRGLGPRLVRQLTGRTTDAPPVTVL